jgi:hypothetical protein
MSDSRKAGGAGEPAQRAKPSREQAAGIRLGDRVRITAGKWCFRIGTVTATYPKCALVDLDPEPIPGIPYGSLERLPPKGDPGLPKAGEPEQDGTSGTPSSGMSHP